MTDPINWDRQLVFANTGERVWLSHFERIDEIDGPEEQNVAVVSDKEGAGYTYRRVDGSPIDDRAKAAGWLCNKMTEQEIAAARIAIKKAQARRRMERENAEGVEAAGDLWGSF